MDASGSELGTVLTVLVTIVAVVSLAAVVGIVWVMWRYRLPPRALAAMIGALIYLLSPVDVLPEALLGPFGLLDDAGVGAATVIFIYKLVTARRMLRDAGVLGRAGSGRSVPEDPGPGGPASRRLNP